MRPAFLFGAHGLHYSRRQVVAQAAHAVRAAENGVASENVGAAVFAAEDCPLGKHGKTIKTGGPACANDGICKDPVEEGDIDTVVASVKCHRLYIDVGVKQFGAADSGIGAGIQDSLGSGGQVNTQIFDTVLIPTGVGNFLGMDGHCLPQIAGITAKRETALL